MLTLHNSIALTKRFFIQYFFLFILITVITHLPRIFVCTVNGMYANIFVIISLSLFFCYWRTNGHWTATSKQAKTWHNITMSSKQKISVNRNYCHQKFDIVCLRAIKYDTRTFPCKYKELERKRGARKIAIASVRDLCVQTLLSAINERGCFIFHFLFCHLKMVTCLYNFFRMANKKSMVFIKCWQK